MELSNVLKILSLGVLYFFFFLFKKKLLFLKKFSHLFLLVGG